MNSEKPGNNGNKKLPKGLSLGLLSISIAAVALGGCSSAQGEAPQSTPQSTSVETPQSAENPLLAAYEGIPDKDQVESPLTAEEIANRTYDA